MSTPKQFTKAYGADDIGSLQTLDLTIESDEANLTAKVISVQLAKDDGADVTAIKYERALGMKLGHLTLVQFKTDVDKESEKAIHKTQGETFVCEGKAYISGKPVNILVFRDKAV